MIFMIKRQLLINKNKEYRNVYNAWKEETNFTSFLTKQ